MGKIKNLGKLMIQMPLGIAYIAAYLKKNDVSDVEIIDAYAEDLSIEDTVNACVQKKADLIGLTCVTASYPVVCEIARRFKEVRPHATVVLGGEHPSILTEDTLKNEFIDFVVRGEGEVTFLALVKCLDAGGSGLNAIDGISFKSGDGIIHNRNREQIRDLDEIPFPAYELLPMHLYMAPPQWAVSHPAFQVIASRGCPHRCTFCSLGIMGKRRRVRSPKNVVAEIEHLIKNYHAKQIMFWDAIFPVNKAEGVRFCREFIDNNIHKKIKWSTECHVNVVDRELLALMYKAGCRIICYGIESGVQKLLDNVNKNIKIHRVRKAIDETRRAKIRTYGSYIIGLPGETRETVLQTIRFAKELDTDYAQFSLLTPYPGTAIFKSALERGAIKTADWNLFLQAATFTEYNPVYIPDGMGMEEFKRLGKKAYKDYYLRPRMLLKHLKYLKSPKDVFRYMEVGKAIIRGVS